MISRLLVGFYMFLHGTLHLPGGGWLIRRCLPFIRGLNEYPFHVPGVGTAILDFRDGAAFGLLNVWMGDYDHNKRLFAEVDKVIRPNDVLWDIGANVGYFLLYFCKPPIRPFASIHAFEPTPNALKSLTSLFRNYSKVTVHPIALGSANEQAEMTVSTSGSPDSSFVRKELQGANRIMVQVRTGDSYQTEKGLPLPNIIKIDVEGFETQVLRGLDSVIAKSRPIIFFEHIWLKEDEILTLIPPDYQLLFIPDTDTDPLSPDFQSRMTGHNALLLPKERLG